MSGKVRALSMLCAWLLPAAMCLAEESSLAESGSAVRNGTRLEKTAEWQKASEQTRNASQTQTEIRESDRRSEALTFLTFPEWFLVFSREEMTSALEAGAGPSNLPWMTHVGQVWASYFEVWRRVREGGAEFNVGYHAMIWGKASSTTVEYAIKGLYETTIGRVFEWGYGRKTAEDELEVKEARRYVEFIKGEPWYKFDFNQGLQALWNIGEWDETEKGAVPRRLERLFKLTVEWGVKSAFASVIMLGTGVAYEKPIATSVSVLVLTDGRKEVVVLPRHVEFTKKAQELANQGVEFESICGNNGKVLVSVIMEDSAWLPRADVIVLLEQKIPSKRGMKRAALEVQVKNLSAVLRWGANNTKKVKVEHIFDY